MNSLPLAVENIILDYKIQMELEDSRQIVIKTIRILQNKVSESRTKQKKAIAIVDLIIYLSENPTFLKNTPRFCEVVCEKINEFQRDPFFLESEENIKLAKSLEECGKIIFIL